jgi:hypothetical protein
MSFASTAGQVMEFVVNATLTPAGPLGASPTDPVDATGAINPNAAVDPWMIDLSQVAEGPLGPAINAGTRRNVSLNEGESEEVCVTVTPDGSIVYDPTVLPGPTFLADCIKKGDVRAERA